MLGKWKLITGLLRCFLPSFHPLMKYDALFNFNSSCVWGIKNHAASLVLSTYCLLRHSTKEKEHLLSSNKNRAQQKQNLAINSLSSEDNFFGLSLAVKNILLLLNSLLGLSENEFMQFLIECFVFCFVGVSCCKFSSQKKFMDLKICSYLASDELTHFYLFFLA